MATDWHIDLGRSVNQEVEQDNFQESNEFMGVWESVDKGLNPNQRKPQVDPDVIVRELSDRQGNYFVLKNKREKTYMRLSLDEHRLFIRMDGQSGMEELVFEHFIATNNFAPKMVANLVEKLYQHHMLTEIPVAVWRRLEQVVQQQSWSYRLSLPAKYILTRKLSIPKLDQFISWFYHKFGWLLFTRPAKVILLLISIIGFIAFSQVIADPRYAFLEEEIVLGLALLWLAAIFPLVIHELGHALTVKHYGREVPRGGLMLFFGMPAAFVDTTDIWLEPRRARLEVTWNGPYTGLILGGAAAILIYFYPEAYWNSLLFKMAGFAYFTVFINVNPLLKLDGYYLLSDALNIPSLRERSFAFVRKQFLGKLLKGQNMTRNERIYAAFGVLSLVWTIYAVYLISFFWQTRLRMGMQALFGEGYSIIARIMSLLIVVAIGSVVVLLLIGVYRLLSSLVSRFLQSGLLERHSQLALVGGGVALALGLLIPLIPFDYSAVLSILIGLTAVIIAVQQVVRFNLAYRGSARAKAHMAVILSLCLAGGLALISLLPVSEIQSDLLLAGFVVSMMFTGLFFIWPPHRRLMPGQFLLGLLIGGLIYAIFPLVSISNLTDLSLIGLVSLVVVGSWSVLSLLGSARLPAASLFFLGSILIVLTSINIIPLQGINVSGLLLMSVGGLHLVHARLPKLSSYVIPQISSHTPIVIRQSVGNLVRRVISQVFFETGWRGVIMLGQEFTSTMQKQGVNLSITANHFEDKYLEQRSVDELTYVYGIAFDELHRLVSQTLGRRMATLSFAYGIDLLPWQYREVVAELILSRQPWGLDLNQEIVDARIHRRKLLKRVPLFVNCSQEELDRIAAHLRSERFAAGETVIRQGDQGDKFYIIEAGNVTIWQVKPDSEEEFIVKGGPGQYFGEVALVTNAVRNATVRAETPLTLLSLRKQDFDRLVRRYVSLESQMSANVRYSWLLRGMPIFDELDSRQLDHLAERLESERFNAGEVVVKVGDPGDKFYIVESGELIVIQEKNGEMVEISRRGPGEYVGEIALLQTQARTATLIAAKDTNLLSLKAGHFQELVSSVFGVGQKLALTGSRRLTFLEFAGGQQA
jgi:putative peptide zinc metalloprotease protein